MKIKNTGSNGKGRRKIVRSNDKDEKKVEEVNLDYLVDLDSHEASEAAIQAQIARIE